MKSNTTKLATTLVATLILISSVAAKSINSPFRMRVNQELIQTLFQKYDQDLFKLFTNMKFNETDLPSGHKISDLEVSFVPQSGTQEDYNFGLSFDQDKFVGLEAKDLKFQGKGNLVNEDGSKEEFELEGPINQFRINFVINQEGAKALNYSSYDFEIGDINIKNSKSSYFADNKDAFKQAFKEAQTKKFFELVDYIDNAHVDKKRLLHLPILALTPLLFVYSTGQLAEHIDFKDNFIEYKFTPKSLQVVNKTYDDLLQPIDSDFIPQAAGEDQSALQLIVEENLINGIVTPFIKIDKMYSLRNFMATDPRFGVFSQLLTTTTVAMVLPSFKEEYGEGKQLDLVATVSHDFIEQGIPGAQPSGLTIDKNGNFQLTANLGAQLIVNKGLDNWVDARTLYIQLALKGKMFVADAEYENRTFVMLPKGIYATQLKIYKGEEEQYLEQMLAQSLLGAQFEQMKKALKPMIIPLKKFPNPPEFECLGFNFTNVDIKINKGYVQLNANYLKIDTPNNQTYCNEMMDNLKNNPQKLFESLRSGFGGFTGMGPGGAGAGDDKTKGLPPSRPKFDLSGDSDKKTDL